MSSESVALTRINVLRGINICEQIWKSDGSEHICSNRSVQIYFALMKYYCHGIQTLYDTCTYLKVPLQFSPAEGAVCKDFVLCCEYKCDLYLNQLVYSQCCDPHKDTLPGLITGWGHNLKYEKHKHFFTQQRVEKHKQMTTALWSNQFHRCFQRAWLEIFTLHQLIYHQTDCFMQNFSSLQQLSTQVNLWLNEFCL